jgi:hypothetical protein
MVIALMAYGRSPEDDDLATVISSSPRASRALASAKLNETTTTVHWVYYFWYYAATAQKQADLAGDLSAVRLQLTLRISMARSGNRRDRNLQRDLTSPEMTRLCQLPGPCPAYAKIHRVKRISC